MISSTLLATFLSIQVIIAATSITGSLWDAVCIRPMIRNGITRLRGRGRTAKFICVDPYRRIGPQYVTCVNGRWDSELPFCVRNGCIMLGNPLNGLRHSTNKGAVLAFECNEGFVLNGSSTLYCDGKRWNGTSPSCSAVDNDPATFCDFDNEDLCGWIQDRSGKAMWQQHMHKVPARVNGTGPSFDHTFGEGSNGRYMYVEGSSLREEDERARLLSPTFTLNVTSETCFSFWYHMYGDNMGHLRIYQKELSKPLSQVNASFDMQGNQGDEWKQGIVMLQPTKQSFQMIFEAARGNGVLSDIAIDDVSFATGENCSTNYIESEDSKSCEWRCGNGEPEKAKPSADNATCSCSSNCGASCCNDFEQFCTRQSTFAITSTTVFKTPSTLSTTSTPSITTTVLTTSTKVPTTSTKVPTTSTRAPTTSTRAPTTSTRLPPTKLTTKTSSTKQPTTSTKSTTTKVPITSTKAPTTPKLITRTTITTTKRTTSLPTTKTTRKPTTTTKLTTRAVLTTVTMKREVATTWADMHQNTTTPSTYVKTTDSETGPGWSLLLVAAGCAGILIVVSGITISLLRRTQIRRRLARENGAEDSDVRFLTASDGDIQLDFTLASPSHN